MFRIFIVASPLDDVEMAKDPVHPSIQTETVDLHATTQPEDDPCISPSVSAHAPTESAEPVEALVKPADSGQAVLETAGTDETQSKQIEANQSPSKLSTACTDPAAVGPTPIFIDNEPTPNGMYSWP